MCFLLVRPHHADPNPSAATPFLSSIPVSSPSELPAGILSSSEAIQTSLSDFFHIVLDRDLAADRGLLLVALGSGSGAQGPGQVFLAVLSLCSGCWLPLVPAAIRGRAVAAAACVPMRRQLRAQCRCAQSWAAAAARGALGVHNTMAAPDGLRPCG